MSAERPTEAPAVVDQTEQPAAVVAASAAEEVAVVVTPAATETVPAAAAEAVEAAAPPATTDAPAAAENAAGETGNSVERKKRDRSNSGRHHHDADNKDHAATKHARGEERDSTKPQALSAAAKKESELSEDTCVRFGIFETHRAISKEEFMDEMDSIRMLSAVEKIILEPFTPGQDTYFWARIYFNSVENADIAATELNIPLRKSKWRLSVTQRLPLKGPNSGEIGTIPAFQPFACEPSDTVVVDTQEGYVAFSTDELYMSRSATEFIEAKRNGRLIRRLICKHFDSERRIPCRYGVGCSFMHIKANAANRLLRTVGHRAPLRFTKQDEDIQVGTWEYERRHDTLLVRHLAEDMTQKDLAYMFSNCAGFICCSVFANKDDKNNRVGSRFGLIRFNSKATAMATLLQTFDSNLNIGFFGVMEDIRRMQMHSVKEQRLLPSFDTCHQTHVFFSPITNQVIGLTERANNPTRHYNNTNNNNGNGNYHNNNQNNNYNNYNNNNRYNNNGGNQPGGPSGDFNQQRYNSNYNNRYNNNTPQGPGNYNNNNRYNNQGRQHEYGNDRYSNNSGGGNDRYGGGSNSSGSYGPPAGNSFSNNGGDSNGAPNVGGPLFAAPSAAPPMMNNNAHSNSNNNNNHGTSPAGTSNNKDEPVPFPPLPSGWGYGVSRRTGKYYFFEHGSKAPTTFKHPITGDKYGGN